MSLVDYNFKPDYNKSENDIAQEFYLPAMRNIIKENLMLDIRIDMR